MSSTFNHKTALFLALIFGTMVPYAFAPYGWLILALIGLGGWLSLLLEFPKLSFKLGLSFGFGWFGFGAWWLADTIQIYGHLPYIVGLLSIAVLGSIMSVFFATWAWVFHKLSHRKRDALWLFPTLAVCEEWFRSVLFTGLPWTALGNLLVDTPLASWVSIIGSYGATFIIVLISTAFTLLFYRSTRPLAIISIAICILLAVFSPYIDVPKQPSHTAALIQPNIPQDKKWDTSFLEHTMTRLTSLSAQASQQNKLDLIVWPEAAVPFYLSRSPSWNNWLIAQMNHWQTPVIFGGIKLLTSGKSQNGLFLNDATQQRQFVGKHHLVPFGEYVPSWLPWLGKLVPDIGDFEPATDKGLLVTGNQRVGSIICYESIFPKETSKRITQGANVLVVVTNDAWYDQSPAAWQHLQASQMRAIESGRYILRATNTGISAIIAPDGNIQQTLPWWQEGVVIGQYQPLEHITFYQQWGNSPIFSLIFLILAWSGYQTYRREQYL